MTAPYSLAALARALGGDISGGQVLAPGPGHSANDRSLAVRPAPTAPRGYVVHSFASDDPLVCRDHVAERLGLRAEDRRCWPLRRLPRGATRGGCNDGRAAPTHARGSIAKEASADALALWRVAQHPAGSPVEAYLARRGLTLPTEAAGEAIRFHPRCRFGFASVPCMVALVRDVMTNKPVAIHRTVLNEIGEKIAVNGRDRMALGPVAGSAVKLTPDEEVTLCLGVGEGIESTLSLSLAPEFGQSPVWALLSAGQIAAFPVVSGIEALWIGVDHDPAGIRASRQCGARWRAVGREVFLVKPRGEGLDLNDLADE